MLRSWLRLLLENRFKGRAPCRPPRRLEAEALEERASPTIVTWTGGNDFNTSSVHDVLSNGTITRPGDPTWGTSNNWQNFVSPQNNDDVVFPTGVPTSEKIDKTSTRQAPPAAYSPLNSSNNLNLTLNSLTISDKDFNIGGNAITLQSDLVGDSNFHGTTAINFDIRLLGNPQSLRVLNSDATLFLGGNLSDASGTSGLIKQGAGTVVLAGNNSFTGLTEVSRGILVGDGATLQIASSSIAGEALELTG
ncbi:MAG TPA: autotransporter-associated beta strand repeat-containing protein, partial [Gemmataceae bacterium]|nr:autotransporter-associated beta strand repeat-containing protein [Gemmataceae bacterium]